MGAIEDIVAWSSAKLSPWKQDALRRLACQSTLAKADLDEILATLKAAVGFAISPAPPVPVPLEKAHFASATLGTPLHIKTIRNVENVNRLVPSAGLAFAPNGLTVVYGRNGSGKSGFVRIFRTACRTRVDRPEKLKVLADVYGSGSGPQRAEIVIDSAGAEEVVPWTSGGKAHERLLHVAVFDSSAAQLYVDSGSQITFLPFGLALPHKLNELCLELKTRLEDERKPVTLQLGAATINFATMRQTVAQSFYGKLGAKATDAQIAKVSAFTKEDQDRLDTLTRLLTGGAASAADLQALATWITTVCAECVALQDAVGDGKLEAARAAKATAVESRKLAGVDSTNLFKDEPLPGIGTESWRFLWSAACAFSTSEAYKGQAFPVVSTDTQESECVLCLQPLGTEASARLKRFETFVSGEIATAAEAAEASVTALADAVPQMRSLASPDWDARLKQISERDQKTGEALAAFKINASERLALLKRLLGGTEDAAKAGAPPPPLAIAVEALNALAEGLVKEATDAEAARNDTERLKLVAEHAELEDRKMLSLNVATVKQRRDLLAQDQLFAAALAEVTTTAITKRANELVDEHLTKVVLDQYEAERQALEISHLKVGLTRKSGKTNAAFQTDSGTALTKVASDILSEGEQRALALAAFFTEVAVTDGNGPIVVDDPVSSLDRQRSGKVAARIVQEAKNRQVIVFTHDLVFFNELCELGHDAGVPCECIGLFADGANAGKVDPAGVIWKGLNVDKRLKRIKQDAIAVKKLHATSPADYEVGMKNIYGRLRDTYERAVEEIIFCDVVRRGTDVVQTQKLRYIQVPDALAIAFHDGMSKASTHSHDNPQSETVQTPSPAEFDADVVAIEALIANFKAEHKAAEAKRPSMKPK